MSKSVPPAPENASAGFDPASFDDAGFDPASFDDASFDPASFDDAWQSVRADEDIQFSNIVQPEPPETPQWWQDFLKWMSDFLAPAGEALVGVLLVLLAAGVLTLLWVILQPYIEEWRGRKPGDEDDLWQPEEGVARRLLEEADALAAKGQYEEAAHLLLFRSIEDIERRRPDLLRVSNTAREIERLENLPDKARSMFAVMAGQVERGIFAATAIGKEGWEASREAYGEFALPGIWKSGNRKKTK